MRKYKYLLIFINLTYPHGVKKQLMQKFNKKTRGFTLLEILLVVGIISLLAGIVIVAINPGRQLAQTRNVERRSDLKQLNSAIIQFYIDNSYYPASTSLLTTLTEICDTGTATSSTSCGSLINLTELVPTYITAIPVDPQGPEITFLNKIINTVYAATGGTGYYLGKDSTNKIILVADRAELGAVIAIGTTTVATGGEVPVDACEVSGDATDPDCWSTPQSNIAWSTEYVATGIQDDTLGLTNTNQIVAFSNGLPYDAGSNYPAAKYCYDLDEGGHTDWYLPAVNQLIAGLEEFKTQYNLGSTTWADFSADTPYWSSTEELGDPDYFAWMAIYYSHNEVVSFSDNKSGTLGQTRCLR